MTRRRWEYAAASMLAESNRSIGVCAVTGIITQKTAQAVIADNHRWSAELAIGGQAIDYRGAALCVDEHELMRSAVRAMSEDAQILRPAALIVTPEQFDVFNRYTWLMAQHGVCRAAFTEMEPALDWARRQAEVFARWPALRQPASVECSHTADASTRLRQASDPA